MRKLSLSLALILALSICGCKQTQAKKDAAPSVTKGQGQAQTAGLPDSRTPEQKKKEAQIRAEKQVMINALNDVVGKLQDQGIEVRHSPKKHPWRLIVPALSKVGDEQSRKTQATQIAQDFKTKLEKILQHPIDVDVYSDAKETQKLN